MNWSQSVMMGFLSGLCEPLPMSAQAHRALLRRMMGVESEGTLFLLCCHIAILTVLLAAGRLEIRRLRRTGKLLRTPPRRRTGRPELNSAGTLRLLRSGAVLVLAGRLLAPRLEFLCERLWLLAVPLFVSGLILWIPTLLRTANKDGRHLAAVDGTLMGLGALMAAVPGLSLVGTATAVGSVRGADRSYALRFAWLLLSISMAAAICMDLLALITGGFTFVLEELLVALLGAAAAALGTYLAIQLARSVTRPGRSGLSVFCYYNWGQALLCIALFLLV